MKKSIGGLRIVDKIKSPYIVQCRKQSNGLAECKIISPLDKEHSKTVKVSNVDWIVTRNTEKTFTMPPVIIHDAIYPIKNKIECEVLESPEGVNRRRVICE